MELAQLNDLRTQVLAATFLTSLAFGYIAQRTHFCTMGAVSDVVNMGSWVRMRMWGLAVGVAMLGFHGLVFLGLIDPTQTIYASGRVIWLSGLVGGSLFGFGMVLASGCGSKTLVRVGAGSLKGVVVFLVMGFAAFATMRGIVAVVRVETVDQMFFDVPGTATLPALVASWLGAPLAETGLVMSLLIGGGLLLWALSHAEFRSGNNLLAGLGIGGVIVAMWWVSGHLGFVAEHPETLEAVYLATNSGRMESLTFTAPMAYVLDWLIYFSDANKLLTVAVVSVFGVVLGAAVQSLTSGTFRWEGFRNTSDTALHLVGAICMGVGGVTALGCTVGQGLSGLSTLSLTSFFAVSGIFLGAVAGLRFQVWLLDRE